MTSKVWKMAGRFAVCLVPCAGPALALIYLKLFGLHRRFESTGGAHPAELPMIGTLSGFRRTVGEQTLGLMDNAVMSSDSLAWGFATALTLIALLGAALTAGFVIWKAPRRSTRARRMRNTGAWITFSLIVIPTLDVFTHFLSGRTLMTGQLVGVIQSQLNNGKYFNVANVEAFFLEAGYGVAITLVIASSATLLPIGKSASIEEYAYYTRRQMRNLQSVLYAGAVLLVITTFRQNITLRWALDYLQPPEALSQAPGFAVARYLMGRLEVVVSNIVTGTGIMNTLLLTGLYVPAVLVLQSRVRGLARLAVQRKNAVTEAGLDVPLTKEQTDWMTQHGLALPLREQLPKIVAILSPLIAGPVGQLLSFLK